MDFQLFDSKMNGVDYFRYTEFHGEVDQKQRALNLELFNSDDNIHGKVCKIMMISPAGAEGLNTMNVRQVHFNWTILAWSQNGTKWLEELSVIVHIKITYVRKTCWCL